MDNQAEKVQVAPNPPPKETTPMWPSQSLAMSEVQSDGSTRSWEHRLDRLKD